MNNIRIITDSCADLSTDLLEKYDIDYAKMNTVYKGKESPALLSWGDRTPKEFYDILRSGERITTTQVPVPEFKRIVLGLCCGLFLGVHWRVIRAALNGSEMPEMPEGHKCCHKCRRRGTDND